MSTNVGTSTVGSADKVQPAPRPGEARARGTSIALAPLAVALAVAGAVLARDAGDSANEVLRAALVSAWAVAGAMITGRRHHERMGPLVLAGSLVAGVAALAAGAVRASGHGTDVAAGLVSAARLALPLAVSLLPAIGMQMLLSLPDGSCRVSRALIRGAYVVGAVLGVVLWTSRPDLPLWPVGLEAMLAAAVGLAGSNRRYRLSTGVERQRLQWFGWAVVVAAEVTLITVALRLLAGWPPGGVVVVGAATVAIPVALAVSSSSRLLGRVDRLLAHTVSTVGLSGVVVA
ncbi:MAG TPA: hypothetical protein VHS52_01815, partial [Acidimicrobiales bacterium]|nr:hypothetical protein [Acidimicrobiales bacterium]